MADSEQLLKLAEACEKVTGLLAEVAATKLLQDAWKLLNPLPSPWRIPRMPDGSPWPGDGLGPYTEEAKTWTDKTNAFNRLLEVGANIEAANMLKPPGWHVNGIYDGGNDVGWFCSLIKTNHGVVNGQGNTESLARASSALLAHATLINNG